MSAEIDHGPWDGCEEVPFVICEKEGLSGIIEPVCYQYKVPFVAVRGAASITILHDIWELLQTSDLPWRLLTFYDFDKAGLDIEHAALDRLRRFGGEAEWTHQRIAVTPDQIEQLHLPMRPEKRYIGEAVELDAIPPDVLAEIVEKSIQSCIPEDIEDRVRPHTKPPKILTGSWSTRWWTMPRRTTSRNGTPIWSSMSSRRSRSSTT